MKQLCFTLVIVAINMSSMAKSLPITLNSSSSSLSPASSSSSSSSLSSLSSLSQKERTKPSSVTTLAKKDIATTIKTRRELIQYTTEQLIEQKKLYDKQKKWDTPEQRALQETHKAELAATQPVQLLKANSVSPSATSNTNDSNFTTKQLQEQLKLYNQEKSWGTPAQLKLVAKHKKENAGNLAAISTDNTPSPAAITDANTFTTQQLQEQMKLYEQEGSWGTPKQLALVEKHKKENAAKLSGSISNSVTAVGGSDSTTPVGNGLGGGDSTAPVGIKLGGSDSVGNMLGGSDSTTVPAMTPVKAPVEIAISPPRENVGPAVKIAGNMLGGSDSVTPVKTPVEIAISPPRENVGPAVKIASPDLFSNEQLAQQLALYRTQKSWNTPEQIALQQKHTLELNSKEAATPAGTTSESIILPSDSEEVKRLKKQLAQLEQQTLEDEIAKKQDQGQQLELQRKFTQAEANLKYQQERLQAEQAAEIQRQKQEAEIQRQKQAAEIQRQKQALQTAEQQRLLRTQAQNKQTEMDLELKRLADELTQTKLLLAQEERKAQAQSNINIELQLQQELKQQQQLKQLQELNALKAQLASTSSTTAGLLGTEQLSLLDRLKLQSKTSALLPSTTDPIELEIQAYRQQLEQKQKVKELKKLQQQLQLQKAKNKRLVESTADDILSLIPKIEKLLPLLNSKQLSSSTSKDLELVMGYMKSLLQDVD